jgi:hypothetical protein
MDLRGFQAHNAGCRFELTTLAQASRVVLTDSRTDHAAAQEAIASGRQERFTWIEASHLKSSKHREVLVHLCQRLPQLQNLQAIDLDGLFLDR